MQKYFLFFLTIGFIAFTFYSYITLTSKTFKEKATAPQTETQRILEDQKQRIERLNDDYRSIIESSKRQSRDALKQFDRDVLRRDHNRAMEENRRKIEENRRHMEELRRQMQYR